MTTFFKIIPHHSPPNPSGAAVCPAAISVPKPVQGAAQVGMRNRIPGGNSGCCAFPWKLPECCFFYDNSSHKQKQKEQSFVTFSSKMFLWAVFLTYLSFWGLLYFFSEPEPLHTPAMFDPLDKHLPWSLDPSLFCKNSKLKSIQFERRAGSCLPDFDYTASELEDVALASQPFQLGPN